MEMGATEALVSAIVQADEHAASEQRVPVFNLDELRRLAVRQALEFTQGHRGQAATLLGVSLNTMTRLVAESCPEVQSKSGRRRVPPPPQPR
jgi:DNA-binding NtrC family response regulator